MDEILYNILTWNILHMAMVQKVIIFKWGNVLLFKNVH